MSDHHAQVPLLPPSQTPASSHHNSSRPVSHRTLSWKSDHDLGHAGTYRQWGQRMLASKTKHFLIMAVVAIDAAALLANVFIKLIACEMHQADEPWVQTISKTLETIGLNFSCLFMLELAACLVSFGFRFLATPFHLFDAVVIVVSFVVDVASQGLAESIGSLLVVLRLWRLAKISEEVIMGATERMDMLEQHMVELESENQRLRVQLGLGVEHYMA